jgi:hypothetical protein
LLLALLPALAAAACQHPDAPPPSAGAPADPPAAPSRAEARPPLATREGGTLARSPAGDALYLADEDHGLVRRLALPLDVAARGIELATPGQPAQVLALHDRVLVTVRSEGGAAPAKPAADATASRIPASATGPGLLLAYRPDAQAGLVEEWRVALPEDAWGVAVTPDESTVLVTSAWTHQVSAVDLGSGKKRWSVDVGREPRGVVIRADGAAAYVTHVVGAGVTRIDDLAGPPRVRTVTLHASPLREPSGKALDATNAWAATLSPDGARLFVARHAVGAMGEAAWYGAATVDVLLTGDDTPLAPHREPGLTRAEAPVALAVRGMQNESIAAVPRLPFTTFVVPRAVVYRRSTQTLLVASEGTNQVVELDARALDPTLFVRRTIQIGAGKEKLIPLAASGAGPEGIALSADERLLWVHCRSTNDLVEVRLDEPAEAKATSRTHLADDLLGEPDGRGRRIFHDATDAITSGGMSCAGCHPEGRDDGHVWHEAHFKTRHSDVASTNFLGDPDQAPLEVTRAVGHARQTPMLASRVSAKGPYGWHGESSDLVTRLAESFGLHRWGVGNQGYGAGELIGRAQYLTGFLRHGLVPPPRDAHPETPDEARGRAIFTSSQTRCARCHVPETDYTDRASYPFLPALPTPPRLRGREPARVQDALPRVRGRDRALLPRRQRAHAGGPGGAERRSHGPHEPADPRREGRARRLPEDAMTLRNLLPALVAGALALAIALAPTTDAAARPPPDAGALPRFDAEPFSLEPSSAPTLAEWRTSPPVAVVGELECNAYRVREWLKIHCGALATSSIALLGGSPEGVSFFLVMQPNAPDAPPLGGEAIFPLRRGDRRVIEWSTFGGSYEGPGSPEVKFMLSESWLPGEPSPTIVVG